MKISVVIPNFNDLRIRRALDSVLAQSHTNREVLVIDGGSTNPELLEYYRTCGADRVVIEKDGGIFDALNKGVRLATGDVIYLMGSDDELSDPGTFADVAAMLDGDPSLDGVCIGCEFVNAEGKVIRTWYPRAVTVGRMRRGVLPPHFSLFLKRGLYDIAGEFKYREYANVACDSLWLLDLALAKPDLRIAVRHDHHLKMEYGGSSTGSLSAVLRQFRVVHAYARTRAADLPYWFLYSPWRTLSKVTQFKLFRR